jgi:putative tryptophan/tyrosine transport system substrate-binding protein
MWQGGMLEQWTRLRRFDRRQMLSLACAVAAEPWSVWAQPSAAKLARVGFLIPETVADQTSRIDALRVGLAERGWVQGQNVTIEVRAADGAYDRLPRLAMELVALKVDVIVAFGIKALTAAHRATTTTSIVIPATSSDLVALGFVNSFARPGRNITGSTTFGPEIMAKRLELLKETMPTTTRVAVLVNPANASFGPTFTVMDAAAKSLKLSIEPFKVHDRSQFDRVFAAMTKARVDGLVIQDDTIFGETNAGKIAALAARGRLLAVGTREFADAGGALGYGRTDSELYRRGAYFVDRILNGAKPADLPVEQATRFELVINLKVTRAIGIRVPQAVMLRADRVIE